MVRNSDRHPKIIRNQPAGTNAAGGNGDETGWARDSCLSGHYRYVSFPAVTVPKPKARTGDSEVLPAIEVSPPTDGRQTGPRQKRAPQRQPGTCAGFLSTRPRLRRSRARESTSTRCRQAINAVGAAQIARTDSLNIADALQQYVPGISISDVDRQSISARRAVSRFRRVARRRHAAGTCGLPERRAHQRSVRRHRQLGPDPDRCDQVGHRRDQQSRVRPQRARRRRQRADEGRLQLSGRRDRHDGRLVRPHPELGAVGQADRQYWPVYGALEGLHDNGFRNFSESDIRRFYGDVGYRTDSSEFHLNMGVANNNFGAAATVPVELLQKYWGATYTTPQTTDQPGRLPQSDRKGRGDADLDDRRLGACSRIPAEDGGRKSDRRRSHVPPIRRCFASTTIAAPANGLNGVQLANPFPADAVLGQIDRTTTRSTTTGATLQATNTDQLFGHNNQFMVGTSFDSGVTRFGGQRGIGHDRLKLRRQRQRHIPRAIRRLRFRSARSRFAPPTSTPGSMRSTRST